MKRYVVGFLFRNNGTEVALVRKLKPEWQRGRLNGIGGKIEPNEDSRAAMVREFAEETGATVDDWRAFAWLRGHGWEVDMYVSHAPAEVRTVEEEEIAWFPVAEIPFLPTIPNLRWLIPMALDKDRVTARVDDWSVPQP